MFIRFKYVKEKSIFSSPVKLGKHHFFWFFPIYQNIFHAEYPQKPCVPNLVGVYSRGRFFLLFRYINSSFGKIGDN